jgi:transposase-like protein
MPGRVFTVEFKRKMVGEIERKEKTIAQACREHQLADSQVHKWRKLFGSGEASDKADGSEGKGAAGEIAALQRKVAELERLCGQMALENSYLKNALGTYPRKRG